MCAAGLRVIKYRVKSTAPDVYAAYLKRELDKSHRFYGLILVEHGIDKPYRKRIPEWIDPRSVWIDWIKVFE